MKDQKQFKLLSSRARSIKCIIWRKNQRNEVKELENSLNLIGLGCESVKIETDLKTRSKSVVMVKNSNRRKQSKTRKRMKRLKKTKTINKETRPKPVQVIPSNLSWNAVTISRRDNGVK